VLRYAPRGPKVPMARTRVSVSESEADNALIITCRAAGGSGRKNGAMGCGKSGAFPLRPGKPRFQDSSLPKSEGHPEEEFGGLDWVSLRKRSSAVWEGQWQPDVKKCMPG